MNHNENVEIKYVNIEDVIRKQKNKTVRNLPKFVINYIKKVIKQDKINDVLRNAGNSKNKEFLEKTKEYFKIDIEIIGFEKIPQKGKFIFVSNHPLGGIDFLSIICVLLKKFENIKIIANEVLMGINNIKEMLLPVGVFSKTSSELINSIGEQMGSESNQILTFPAGLVSRKENGKIEDSTWHRSFIRQAIDNQRDIIPIFVDSVNSKKFYRVASVRKFFGIKAKLEMFLIPGEVFLKIGQKIPVIFGEPISYKTFDESKTHLEWAQHVKQIVYDLKSN